MLLDKAMRHPHYQILAVGFLLTALDPSRGFWPKPCRSSCGFSRSMTFTAICGHRRAAFRIADPADKTKTIPVPAGGAEHMATLVKQLRAGHRNTISSPPET